MPTDTFKLYRSFRKNPQKWSFNIPLWVPGVRGSMSYGELDLSIGEGDGSGGSEWISPKLGIDFYFFGKFKYQTEKWFGLFESFRGAVNTQVVIGNTETTVLPAQLAMSYSRLAFGYAILNKPLRPKYSGYSVYIYSGVRMNSFRLKSTSDSSIVKYHVSPLWVEPIIGFSGSIDIQRWRAACYIDYGGFGLNNKQSLAAQISASYRFANKWSVNGGLQYLNMKYQDVINEIPLDASFTLIGPYASVSFYF